MDAKPNVPSNQIYKAHILDAEGKRTAIIVFSRGKDIPVAYDGVAVDNVMFSDLQIHLDDSIRVIKKKILLELWNPANPFTPHAYEEMYLFGKTRAPGANHRRPPASYFRFGNATETGAVNPFLTNVDEPLPPTEKQVLFENRLLLNHPPLYSNDIYVCFADDVLERFSKFAGPRSRGGEDKSFSDATIYALRTYFPLLDINTASELAEKRSALMADTRDVLNQHTEQLYRSVQLFYDVYNATERNTQYIRKGIQSIHFRIRPFLPVSSVDIAGPDGVDGISGVDGIEDRVSLSPPQKVLPLDLLFKLIHCSKDIPFIKFNPGNRRENLYRLYYEKMSPDGKKIPVLSPKQIYKLSRETARSGQISVYLHSGRTPMFLHFDQTGDITVQCTMSSPMSRENLDVMFTDILNPAFAHLNAGFRATGYVLPPFGTLTDSNIQVVSMKYVAGARIERDVKIDKIQCIYSLLTVNAEANTDAPIVRYKRVENYKEMDAETALIIELYNAMKYTALTGDEMVDIVAQRFGMSEERAKSRVVEGLRDAHEYNGAIVEHPGFPMKIDIAHLDYVLEFEVDHIDSVRYIEPLEIYIESIIKMTQEIKPRSEMGAYIRDVCSHSKRATTDLDVVDSMVVSGIVSKNAMAIQPFAVSNTEPIDIFQELGLSDEYDADPVELTEEDEDATALLSELYKHSGVEPLAEPLATNKPSSLGSMITSILPPSLFGNKTETTPDITQSKTDFPTSLLSPRVEGLPVASLRSPENFDTSPLSVPLSDDTVRTTTNVESTENDGRDSDSDSDSDSDDEKGVFFESDDESPTDGGAKVNHNHTSELHLVVDREDSRIRPDGLSLNHPNPFLRRMQTREPALFLTKPQGKKYKSYSASCQPTSRQPVILTDAEKTRIDKEFPGSYKNAIQYGTDPKNPYWYICPRYWCFLTNSSISEEDVKAGKCGTIIPENATTIPPGAYVYEFKGDEHTDVKGKYVEHHPGFLKDGKHPDGYCLPCCFKNWDKSGQKGRREQCTQETGQAILPEPTEQQHPPKSALYVISLDTYPVPPTRWGFAPLPIQLLLNVDYRTVVDKNNPAIVLPNTPTFLRYGVEQVDNQSFLGVFADIYAYQQRQLAIPTVAEFKGILATQITLDVFVGAHNATLATTFRKAVATEKAVATDKYKATEFAKRLDLTKPEQMDFLKDTILAYENFIAYITHPVDSIDHTYLWDIFTSDIPGLNRGGVNLVLLEIMDNDVTDNIQLICPTNPYSKYAYDSRKETVILLKHDNIYEPIYLYEFVKTGDRVGMTAQRTFRSKTLHQNIQRLLANIEKTSDKYCAPLPSLPKVYTFTEPILLDDLVDRLHQYGWIPVAQITNYRNKVIGITVRVDIHHTKPEVMVPCFPSAPSTRFRNPVPLKSMDDETVWRDYATTRDTLRRIYQESNRTIPCFPKVKVLEDELVVGILTATNQFVQIIPPLRERIDDGIPEYQSVNPNVADRIPTVAPRIETMERIRLENQFYLAFRTTIREMLNDYVHREKRNAILRVIENPTYLYDQKRVRIETELRTLVADKVVFVDIELEVLMDLHEITECASDAKESPYCIMKENGVLQLSIPKTNLLSKTQDNESMYYARMADELLRNQRVRLFMFDADRYFNLADVRYQIHSDEFILSQTALHGDYFDNLAVFNTSGAIHHTNYENATPSVRAPYADQVVPLREQYGDTIQTEDAVECIDSVVDIVGNARSLWKRSFPATAREVVYKNTVACSYFVLVSILKTHTGNTPTLSQIKEQLWNGYSRILDKQPEYFVKIVGMLRRQGKRDLMVPVVKRQQTLESLIFSDDYYMSDMDIWVMAQTYQLPIILFSPNGLKGFAQKLEWLKCSGRLRDKYFFVRSTIRADKPNGVANYHLVQPALLLSETREFSSIISDATDSGLVGKYSRNIHTIEETLDEIEIIAKS